MSLFEQAIAKLRKKSAGDRPPDSDSSNHVAVKEVDWPVKRSVLDLPALRGYGYLPEESVSRRFADQYRRIKRPLIDKALATAATPRPSRVIMVTSALPGDGKTFTSVNLALSMALERDISVLLVDCDVAMRRVSEIVNMQKEPGLVDALHDESLEIESLVSATDLGGLSILPAGRRTEGTAELLSSNRMRHVVSSLCARSQRRILLLDSPPLLVTNEAQALAKIAGQVVVVVRAGHTPRQAIVDAIGLLESEQPGGIILNQVNVKPADGYYGYGYGSYGPPPDG